MKELDHLFARTASKRSSANAGQCTMSTVCRTDVELFRPPREMLWFRCRPLMLTCIYVQCPDGRSARVRKLADTPRTDVSDVWDIADTLLQTQQLTGWNSCEFVVVVKSPVLLITQNSFSCVTASAQAAVQMKHPRYASPL